MIQYKPTAVDVTKSLKAMQTHISEYIQMQPEDWDLIASSFKPETFRKHGKILQEGSVCRYFYFLEKGLIRFYQNHDGHEVTTMFTMAPYFFTSRQSFRQQNQSNEGIEALDETLVLKISHQDFIRLNSVTSWNLFMRKLLNEIQEHSDQMMFEIRTLTAEQRYLQLLARHSADLMRKIPLKHLATFLGVAPQSLSRIRKKYDSLPK
jgi:CRP/FNR family transcriptional regulator, anaerobic regulatory protein